MHSALRNGPVASLAPRARAALPNGSWGNGSKSKGRYSIPMGYDFGSWVFLNLNLSDTQVEPEQAPSLAVRRDA